jgi:quinol monooxygenase YgiN
MWKTSPMIIVQGVFQVAAENREQFLAESLKTQGISRGEQGCIEYVFAADPVDDGRVVLSERWETRTDLEAHIATMTARIKTEPEDGPARVKPFSRLVSFFEATETQL